MTFHKKETEKIELVTRPAEIQMTGPPQIESSPEQRGVAGDNVHIKCQARAIPRAQKVIWTYHGHQIEEGQSPCHLKI